MPPVLSLRDEAHCCSDQIAAHLRSPLLALFVPVWFVVSLMDEFKALAYRLLSGCYVVERKRQTLERRTARWWIRHDEWRRELQKLCNRHAHPICSASQNPNIKPRIFWHILVFIAYKLNKVSPVDCGLETLITKLPRNTRPGLSASVSINVREETICRSWDASANRRRLCLVQCRVSRRRQHLRMVMDVQEKQAKYQYRYGYIRSRLRAEIWPSFNLSIYARQLERVGCDFTAKQPSLQDHF